MPDPRRVVVTGLGLVTPFGLGVDAFWEGIVSGRSAAVRIETVESIRFPAAIACPVDDACFDPLSFLTNRKGIKTMGRAAQFAAAASRLAVEDAGADTARLNPLRCGVALGVGGVGLHDWDYLEAMRRLAEDLQGAASVDDGSVGSEQPDLTQLSMRHLNPLTPLKILPNIAAAHVAIERGFRGENMTLCTACTSGAQAIGEAVRVIRHGMADLMLAGGADAMINPTGLTGFSLLGVLSRRIDDPSHASRPFDLNRDGFVMGEGAALAVLESYDHARGRGARILAEVLGYSSCSDAYRVTDEREDGSGSAQAIRGALDSAGIPPREIDYVNAHGTGTRMNDRTEVLALRTVLGPRLDHTPVSSTKSQIGHLVAAAGAVEFAACVLALRHQTLPPTINFETRDPECDVDVVPNRARPTRVRTILSNSFGFGGQNACLVLREPDGSAPARDALPTEV